MNAKEFAEKYAGKRVALIYPSSMEGIVIGYHQPLDDYVLVQLFVNDDEYGWLTSIDNLKRNWTILCEINEGEIWNNDVDIANIILLPETNNSADDCLECGASGDDPCKADCPNKE
jgi:hypothetical protein